MANMSESDGHSNDISITVNVKLTNKPLIHRHSDVDNQCHNPELSSNQSNRSVDTTLNKWMAFIVETMKSKYKQILICLLLAIVVTLLAALQNGPLRIRKTPIPTKFFDEELFPIVDYELGDLDQLSLRALQNDVSFVMYYAPWDSECIRIKKEFETIAKHYRNQIFFASINCWYPEGQCRQYYNLKRYPVMLAHVRMAGEVEYKGPIVASYMIPFLDNLLDPIIAVQNEGDLLDLRAKHDAVLIGYFDFNESPQPPGYKQFFSTAVKALASDPWRTVCYCVISSKRVAVKLSLAKPKTLTLFLWNSTEHYGTKAIKTATTLSWVYSRVHQTPTLHWLTPSGVKSSALSDIITKSPTFVLFTPRSFVLGISPYYDVLREVVMDYYNCDNSPLIRSVIHRSILRRHLLEEKLMELEEKCHELTAPVSTEDNLMSTPSKRNIMEADSCCHSQVVRWRPSSKGSDKKCFCTACVHLSLAKCPANCQRFNCLATASRFLTDFDPNSANSSATYCNEIKTSYQPKYTSYYRVVTSCSGTHPSRSELDDKYFISNFDDNSNSYNFDETITKMVEDSEQQHCHRLNLGLKYSDLNFPDSAEGSQHWRSNFTGLACRTNRTLRFAALDSILFPSFAENIGIDVFNESHATVGVIVDSSSETIHVLTNELSDSQTISKRSLVEFIKNFTTESLPRFFKSTSIPSTSGSCVSDSNQRVICVPELNSDTFARVVLDPSKDVVVMYYAQWCGFCSTIAHIYLEVARLFIDVKGIVFARINGDANDLPWEYTVDRYPTILLFPAKRKTESIGFESKTAITTSSLVEFVLKHSQRSVRLQTSLQLCNRNCLLNNLHSSHRHWRSVLRALNYRLREHLLVRQTIRELSSFDKKLTKKKSLQLKELRLFSTHLIGSIRSLRHKSVKISLFRTFISDKIKNFDSNRLSAQSISEIQALFNPTPIKANKKLMKRKVTKTAPKYSTEATSAKRDEL